MMIFIRIVIALIILVLFVIGYQWEKMEQEERNARKYLSEFFENL